MTVILNAQYQMLVVVQAASPEDELLNISTVKARVYLVSLRLAYSQHLVWARKCPVTL